MPYFENTNTPRNGRGINASVAIGLAGLCVAIVVGAVAFVAAGGIGSHQVASNEQPRTSQPGYVAPPPGLDNPGAPAETTGSGGPAR